MRIRLHNFNDPGATISGHITARHLKQVLTNYWFTHPAERTLTSDWSINSFIMDVYQNVFNVQSEFSVQSKTKNIFL